MSRNGGLLLYPKWRAYLARELSKQASKSLYSDI